MFDSIQTLKPGAIYEDSKGTRFLYIGFGDMWRSASSDGKDKSLFWHTGPNHFIYMKVERLEKKMHMISPDLRIYDPKGPNKPDFWHLFFASVKPRKLVKFVKQQYPEGFFKNYVVTDYSPTYYEWGAYPPYFYGLNSQV